MAMDLSVDEIINACYARESKDIVDAPVRYIPKSIITSAKNDFLINGDSLKVLDYILNAFYIYRETVNNRILAPHILVGNYYEWPTSIYFDWSDIDTVISVGKVAYAPKKSGQILVEHVAGDKLCTRTFHKIGNALVKDVSVRDITPKDQMNKVFKYEVNDISDVLPILSMNWQLDSLKAYAGPIAYTLINIENGKMPLENVNQGMIPYLEMLDDLKL